MKRIAHALLSNGLQNDSEAKVVDVSIKSQLGKYGVWRTEKTTTPEHAAAIEQLGFGTLWIGGSPGGQLDSIKSFLDATTTLTVATGITNIWRDDPASIARAFRRIEAAHPGRFVLGLGTSHSEVIGQTHTKPYTALVTYLDDLEAENLPQDRVVLAALGPRALTLAAQRAAGAHPYLTTPEHTSRARRILGPNPVLAPEQKVILDSDPDRARATAREMLSMYLGFNNYLNMLRSSGFTDADFADGGSDRLVDSLVVHGSPADISRGLDSHLLAGADHVCMQVLPQDHADPISVWQQISHDLLQSK